MYLRNTINFSDYCSSRPSIRIFDPELFAHLAKKMTDEEYTYACNVYLDYLMRMGRARRDQYINQSIRFSAAMIERHIKTGAPPCRDKHNYNTVIAKIEKFDFINSLDKFLCAKLDEQALKRLEKNDRVINAFDMLINIFIYCNSGESKIGKFCKRMYEETDSIGTPRADFSIFREFADLLINKNINSVIFSTARKLDIPEILALLPINTRIQAGLYSLSSDKTLFNYLLKHELVTLFDFDCAHSDHAYIYEQIAENGNKWDQYVAIFGLIQNKMWEALVRLLNKKMIPAELKILSVMHLTGNNHAEREYIGALLHSGVPPSELYMINNNLKL